MQRRNAILRLAGLTTVPLLSHCGLDKLASPTGRTRRLGINTVAAVSPPIPLFVAPDPHFSTNTVAYQIATQIKNKLADNPMGWALYPGDISPFGSASEYSNHVSKALDPILHRTLPVVGNHDCLDANNKAAQSYFAYFGSQAGQAGKGYYLKTFGDTWVGFFLNSQWGRAEQAAWLAAELPKYADRHVFAVLHIPYLAAACNMGGVRSAMNWPGFNGMGQLWAPLEQHGAEFMLSGHVHNYQVFPRMIRNSNDPFTGTVDDRGLRQFVCGTGGTPTLMPFWTPANPHPNVAKALSGKRGPLELTLHQNHYEWSLSDYSNGALLDTGSQACRKTVVPPQEEPEEPPTCG